MSDTTTTTTTPRTPPLPSDLEAVLPQPNQSICESFARAAQFDVLMTKFVEWMVGDDGQFTPEFQAALCAVECTTTTTIGTGTTTTTTSGFPLLIASIIPRITAGLDSTIGGLSSPWGVLPPGSYMLQYTEGGLIYLGPDYNVNFSNNIGYRIRHNNSTATDFSEVEGPPQGGYTREAAQADLVTDYGGSQVYFSIAPSAVNAYIFVYLKSNSGYSFTAGSPNPTFLLYRVG